MIWEGIKILLIVLVASCWALIGFRIFRRLQRLRASGKWLAKWFSSFDYFYTNQSTHIPTGETLKSLAIILIHCQRAGIDIGNGSMDQTTGDLKVSFPLAETCIYIKNTSWTFGYGSVGQTDNPKSMKAMVKHLKKSEKG